MKKLLIAIAIFSIIYLSLVYTHISNTWSPNDLAIIKMWIWLFIIWWIIWWFFQFALKNIIKKIVHMTPEKWKMKFFVMCVLLVSIEEFIAVIMTNNAENFWWEVGKAYITASSNYFEVIFLHSIIVFLPMFYSWVVLLKKYSFSASQALFFFGVSWIIWEIFMNPIALISWFWIFIYWLMIALPVYCLPKRDVKKPWFFAYIQALVLPTLFSLPAVWIALFLQNIFV